MKKKLTVSMFMVCLLFTGCVGLIEEAGNQFLKQQETTAEISDQKTHCAAAGIALSNYKEEFPTSAEEIKEGIRIKYKGKTVNNPGGTPSCSIKEASLTNQSLLGSCSIGNPEGKMFKVYITEDNCTIKKS